MPPALWLQAAQLMDAVWGGGCFSSPLINMQDSAYWPSLALGVLLMAGVVLLAALRTAGLLLTAIVAVILPVFLVASVHHFYGEARLWLVIPSLPGIAAAWVAVVVWVKPLVRTLRS